MLLVSRLTSRANQLGFLGLSIVGIACQFYPPAVGTLTGASDRTALVSIAGLAGSLLVQVVGLVVDVPLAVTAGQLATLGGALAYAFLIGAAFAAR